MAVFQYIYQLTDPGDPDVAFPLPYSVNISVHNNNQLVNKNTPFTNNK